MCGIAGIVARSNSPAIRLNLDRAITALRHRGPDDEGLWSAETRHHAIGLCATRLAIRDTSIAGRQPMVSPRTGAVLCFNGEIYNLDDLRRSLLAAGYAFRGRSDTELVLAAYDEWGPDCLVHLNGMFAIAIWEPDCERLFLARDHVGIKPLYYSETSDGIMFGSELRALFALGLSVGSLSPFALQSFLSFGAISEPETLVAGANLIPAGHFGTWTASMGLSLTEWWSLRSFFARSPVAPSGSEAMGTVRDVLADSVRLQLGSDVPVGVFLSGGIDSSTLVALASEARAEPVRTVSLVFDDPAYSEARFIEVVTRRFETIHTSLELDGGTFAEFLPRSLAAMDQPTVDGVNVYVISQLARECGLPVVLSGLGADELFGGYSTFRDVPRLERAAGAIPAPLRTLIPRLAARLLSNERGDKLARSLGHDRGDGAYTYGVYRELFSPARVSALLSSDGPSGTPSSEACFPDRVNAVSYLELSHYMRNVLLRDADVMSMAHGLELRVPFLDYRLVEYAASLPGDLKLARRTPKPLLVGGLNGVLPGEIVHRPKRGFTLPIDTWLKRGLRKEVEGVLLEATAGGLVAAELHPGAVRSVWQDFIDGSVHWSRPWALYALKCWGESHTRLHSVSAV